MEDQRRTARLLEGCGEGVDELVGQLADETQTVSLRR